VVAALDAVVGRVGQVGDRERDGLDGLGGLAAVGDVPAVGDPGDERAHRVPRDGADVVEPADHLGLGRGEADLLVGLPQRRPEEILVAGLVAAAGKAHPTCVLAEAVGPPDRHDAGS